MGILKKKPSLGPRESTLSTMTCSTFNQRGQVGLLALDQQNPSTHKI